MRKLIAVAMASLMVAGMVSGSAVAGKKKKPVSQKVEGTILLPQGGNVAAPCVYRSQRALYIALGDAANGVVGYTFQVDPKTVGKKFKIDVSDGTGLGGVDVAFYGELGTDPAAEAPANVGYETPGPGGETGTVPAGLPNVMVCLTEGAQATFSYEAGDAVR